MSWTPIGGERQWNYLGFISNEKPSALFKIGQVLNFFLFFLKLS